MFHRWWSRKDLNSSLLGLYSIHPVLSLLKESSLFPKFFEDQLGRGELDGKFSGGFRYWQWLLKNKLNKSYSLLNSEKAYIEGDLCIVLRLIWNLDWLFHQKYLIIIVLNHIEINTVSLLKFNRFLVFSNIPSNIILQKHKLIVD